MPGFGQGPFGTQPFGQWPWSKSVLYDLLPGLYQQQDLLTGGVLKTWTESLRYSFDLMTSLIQNWSDLRNPFTVRTAYDEVTTIVLGPVVTPPAPVEQRGVDGYITPSRQFVSPTARFTQANVGDTITLSQSHIPINNRTFVIASVITPTSIQCNPALITDSGPIRWTLQGLTPLPENVIAVQVQAGDVSSVAPGWVLFDGFSQFTVYERQQFFQLPGGQTSTLTVKDGSKGLALADGRFQAEVALAQTNVGQPFSVSGSTVSVANSDFTNNGKYQIYAVDPSNPTILTFDAPLIIQGLLGSGSLDPNSSVIYSMTIGQTGIQVAHLVYGPSSALFVVVSGSSISVYLASDANSNPTSTAAEVAAAVNGVQAAAALVTASFGGTGASLAALSSFQTVPGTRLLPDPGPLTWSLLPYPQLQLVTTTPPAGITTQHGVDLVLIGPYAYSTTANWSAADVGNVLVVLGSTRGNNQTFSIQAAVNVNQVQISPVTQPSGSTASVTSYTTPLATVTGLSGMTPNMVGLYLALSGAASPGNNSSLASPYGFQIITYFSPSSVAVENLTGVAGDANNGAISWALVDAPLTWAEHTLSGVGFGSSVTVNAPSLIDFLAQDFGITIDDQESEARQRSWVANVTQWIGFKGTALGYEIIGAISGFNVASSALYRVAQLVSEGLPPTSLYIVAETGVGNSGIDGSLTISAGLITFTAPSAQFTPGDVGLVVQTGNCAISSNNALYTIYAYLSPTSVQFAPYNSALVPDYGLRTTIASGSNGQTLPQSTVYVESTLGFPLAGVFVVDQSLVHYTDVTPTSFIGCSGGTATLTTGDGVGSKALPTIQWDVCRIYTTEPPTRPLFDQVNGELMQAIVGTKGFEVDSYCWEPYFINTIPINITAVTPNTPSSVPIYYEVTAEGVALPPLNGTHASVTATSGPYATVTGLLNFTQSWIDGYLALSGAHSSGNNGMFPILAYLSPTSVQIYNPAAVSGDSHNGSISWNVPSAASYSSLGVVGVAGPWQITDSAQQVSYIEPPTDSYQTLTLGSGNSRLSFIAQTPGNTNISITIVSGGSLTITVSYTQIIIQVAVSSTALEVAGALNANPSSVALVSTSFGGVGSGAVAPVSRTYLQGGITPTTLISAGPPSVYSFRVFSYEVPALGLGSLTYNCQTITSCNYCQASAVILLITEGTIASESGPAIINVLDRVILRLQQEVTPIHVRLVPVFNLVLYAVWGS